MDTDEWPRLILSSPGWNGNPLFGRNRFLGWIIRPPVVPGANAPSLEGSLWFSVNGPIPEWFNKQIEAACSMFLLPLNNDPLLIAFASLLKSGSDSSQSDDMMDRVNVRIHVLAIILHRCLIVQWYFWRYIWRYIWNDLFITTARMYMTQMRINKNNKQIMMTA